MRHFSVDVESDFSVLFKKPSKIVIKKQVFSIERKEKL